MPFRVELSCVLDRQLFLVFLCLLLDSFGPFNCPLAHLLEVLMTVFCHLRLVLQFQPCIPLLLVQVQQHFLLQFIRFVVDVDGVVVLV